MNNQEICNHGKLAPRAMLKALRESQAGYGRHKCAVCAYQQGLLFDNTVNPSQGLDYCNHGNSAPISILIKLPDAQSGTGRHKCVICAFRHGVNARQQTPPEPPIIQKDFLEETSAPPASKATGNDKKTTKFAAKQVNYEELNKKRATIGLAGENLVFENEKLSLINAGRPDLAELVKHISVIEGDGAGYDIQSYSTDGSIKYIEVKTTTGSKANPFFITINEVEFSISFASNYVLYRVYEYDANTNSGKFYQVKGNVEEQFNLTSLLFEASRD